MKKLILFCLFLTSIYQVKSQVIESASCALADIQEAINQAGSGDTVKVPSGEAIWEDQLVITKGVILLGAGSESTLIVSNYTIPESYSDKNALIVYKPANPSLNEPFRLSGFSIDVSNMGSGLRIENRCMTKINKIRIDNNIIKNTKMSSQRGIAVMGTVYGVIDNNTFRNNQKHIDVYGVGQDAWNNFEFNYGSEDNLYYEDNVFYLDDTPHSGGDGGRYCARFNTYYTTASLWPWFDAHGNMNAGGNYSTMGVEIYFNTIETDSKNAQIDIRGGMAIVFNNKVLNGSGLIRVREEHDDNILPPAVSPITGQPQHVSNSYFWNNMNEPGDVFNAVLGDQNFDNSLEENREFFNHNTDFDGSAGIGVGLLSDRPEPTEIGVGYWATDDGEDWNKNNTTQKDGVFYKCTSSGTWEEYYTPFEYLHPLRIEKVTTNIKDFEKLGLNLNVFPNPASDKITVEYVLPDFSEIRIALYTIEGKKVKTLYHERKSQGKHQTSISINDLSEKMYILKVSALGQEFYKKCLLVNK